jgi:hypothetical protein
MFDCESFKKSIAIFSKSLSLLLFVGSLSLSRISQIASKVVCG